MTHKQFFFKVLDILEKNNITYWLMCGTLLGAVRDKAFLPSDHSDTDIGILKDDYWKVRKIFNKECSSFFSKYKYNFIRRREITISSSDWKYKVDIFPMERDNDKYYIYSYRKSSTGKWDHEWRAVFPYENFFPLKQINFLGRKVNVPKDPEIILETHYGKGWNKPDPNFVSSTPPNEDKSYKGFYPAGFYPEKLDNKKYDFAYVCVNLLRPEETKKTIISLKAYCPNCKIYIADQDDPSADMFNFYEQYNVEYYFIPFDCGLSYARNFLIKKIEEPYIMWGDNDFVFDKENNIYKAIDLLKSKKNIGVVGGSVYKDEKMLHYERILMYDKEHGILVYIPLELTDPIEYKHKRAEYYYCDLTFNYAIARREVFDNKKIRWNENVKVRYEHSDLFLKLKLYSEYDIVYFPNMKVNHVHLDTDRYKNYRNRKEDALKFSEYWDLRMNFTIGKGKEIYATEGKVIPKRLLEKEIKPNEIEEEAPENEIIKEKSIEEEVINKDKIIYLIKNETVENIINKLCDNNLNFILLKETCLDIVRYKELKLKPNDFHITNNNNIDYNRLIYFLKEQGFKVTNKPSSKKLTIHLYPIDFKMKIKTLKLFNRKVTVPFPVIKYLKEEFGEDWQKYE